MLDLDSVKKYVEENIPEFHNKRLETVKNLRLADVLASKNPYLFKAKNITRADEIVDSILTAYISSSEEGIFGNWLERLAIFINDSVYKGRKGGIEGIDLDFDKDGIRYLVAIKSGPNWGNDSQQKKLADQFASAKKRLSTSGAIVHVACVNGCCYGKSREQTEYKEKRGFYKMCGQRFWELISGEPDLYIKIIDPLGHESETKNEEYKTSYDALVNKFTAEFITGFCKETGEIDWEKLVRFNSGPTVLLPRKVAKAK